MVAPIVWWAALVAASALANNQAQKKVEAAQDRAYNYAERRRRARQAEAQAAAANTEAQYKDQPKKMAEEGAELGEQFKAQQEDIQKALSPNNLITPGETTDKVIGEETRRREGTRRYTNELADALGQMRGVDQSFLGAALQARDNQSEIDMANRFVQGDQNVLGAQLQAAQGKGKNWATLGDILQLAATVYGGYALGAGSAATKAGTVGKEVVGAGAAPNSAANAVRFAGYA
jgi:hypothetical protein